MVKNANDSVTSGSALTYLIYIDVAVLRHNTRLCSPFLRLPTIVARAVLAGTCFRCSRLHVHAL